MRLDVSRPVFTASPRVTTFELFFDLVYVFAFTQVSRLMAETHSALGILQALIVLALLWWTWCSYAWLGNHAAADQPLVRVGMTVAMVAVFIAALTILEAFHDLPGGWDGPLVLALAYVLVRVLHIGLYLVVAGDDRRLRRQVLRTQSVAMLPAAAAIVAGALVGGAAQTWIWLAGFAWDFAFTWLSSRGGGDWRIRSVGHWAERHGLIVILALGESIVAVGVGVAREPIDGSIIAGTVLAVVISVLLWQAYFARLAAAGEAALEHRPEETRAGLAVNAYTYGHLPIVAGVILAALGVEDAMAHIHDVEPFGWFGASALGGGLALYLAATVLVGRLVGLPVLGWRIVAVVVLVASVPLIAVLPPLAALAVVLVVLAAAALVEAFAARRAVAAAR
ncbi:low temperature requirement protein A [Agromyces sp. G08B096]|uniref:Low temperature requirement protein A n=1 Tax=Agromyces sp. G08B096 TaxID=3156399 RepID=A0AAU7W6P2_9MICO